MSRECGNRTRYACCMSPFLPSMRLTTLSCKPSAPSSYTMPEVAYVMFADVVRHPTLRGWRGALYSVERQPRTYATTHSSKQNGIMVMVVVVVLCLVSKALNERHQKMLLVSAVIVTCTNGAAGSPKRFQMRCNRLAEVGYISRSHYNQYTCSMWLAMDYI